LVPVILVLAALAIAARTGAMRERFADSMKDLPTRQANWQAGLAVRDGGVPADLFGMGLGTYQRTMLMRSPVNRPSDIVPGRDPRGGFVSMRVESPFFLGQKIAPPAAGALHLTLRARSAGNGTALTVSLCDKVLLYSDQCRGDRVTLAEPNVWQTVALTLPAEGLGRGFGPLRRPVELSLSGGPVGHRIDIGGVRLADDNGRSVLVNGDFARGLDRWIFTDDSHVSWRMLNEYLMLWFETGGLGLAAFLALSGLAMAGGLRAAWHGAATGAAVTGSVAGFLVCGLFDNVLEAPRLATLFFLICACGLVQWEDKRRRPRLADPR
jgi:hypothetical protein